MEMRQKEESGRPEQVRGGRSERGGIRAKTRKHEGQREEVHRSEE